MENDKLVRLSDAISAAIAGADMWDGGWNKTRDGYIKKALASIPAVDAVELRHGRWEDVEIVDEDIVAENHTMIASMFCPKCKRYASTVYHYGNPLDMMNYCPNCGEKMDGEEAHNAVD